MRGDELFRQLAAREPFSGLHPSLAAFFKDYLRAEKAAAFDGRTVINTHFPPFPSRAFDNLAEHFSTLGDASSRSLYSVTLAVTNRCRYRCWHCYNAGREQTDIPFAGMEKVARELMALGSVMVTLSGGEPLLRDDLEDIAGLFDDRSCLMLNTTGSGLTAKRARRLKDRGLFAIGVSLDSMDAAEHDRMRGMPGAWRTALRALATASDAGLYPYIVTVARPELLEPEAFMRFVEFAGASQAREVHLLEPCPTGRLQGRKDIVMSAANRRQIQEYQETVALRDDLPILSSFVYLESKEAFGCGAGLTYLYVDGSGEVCPCNLVPLSFGNVLKEPLTTVLDRMGRHFTRPRISCAGRTLAGHIPAGAMPVTPALSEEICRSHLPAGHRLPRFFTIKRSARSAVGIPEMADAYDRIHDDYDRHWLSEAAWPTMRLVGRLGVLKPRTVFEAGCGTGYATALLARTFGGSCRITAVDISKEMLGVARARLHNGRRKNVRFIRADALRSMEHRGPFDLIVTSWVLGYIPLRPFFETAARSLNPGGRLAFIVHRRNSPARELRIFNELVADDPSVLLRRVHFDFPEDRDDLERALIGSGLVPEELAEDSITFRCGSPQGVLTHLLKSGAGTAFYDALDPEARDGLEERFLGQLARETSGKEACNVVHDYFLCVAKRAGAAGDIHGH